MDQLKVLRVIPDLQVGGVQRMMLRTIQGLAEYGIQTEVCSLKQPGDLADTFRDAGIRLHVVHFKSRLDPFGLLSLRRLALHGGFDAVHGHMYAANLAVNVALAGQRRLSVLNHYHSITPAPKMGQARKVRATCRLADQIIAVSDAVRRPLLELGVPAQLTTVVYNGIRRPAVPQSSARKSKEAPMELVWTGRFVRQKRLEILVEIVAACRRQGIPVHLTLVGDGPVRPQIRDLVDQHGLEDWISLPGLTHDVTPYLQQADLYVSASAREGFSNALLEAAAAGRGLILSDIPPHREFLGHAGAGCIAGNDPTSWITVLREIHQNRNLVPQLGRAAFERVQRFSLDQSILQLATLYQQLAERQGQPSLVTATVSPVRES